MRFYEAEMKKQSDKIADNLKSYDAVNKEKDKQTFESKEEPLYDAFKDYWSKYLKEHDRILALSVKNSNEEARTLARGDSQTFFDKACDKLLDIIELNKKRANDAKDEAALLHTVALYSTIGVLLAIVAISFLAGDGDYARDCAAGIKGLNGCVEPDCGRRSAADRAGGKFDGRNRPVDRGVQ